MHVLKDHWKCIKPDTNSSRKRRKMCAVLCLFGSSSAKEYKKLYQSLSLNYIYPCRKLGGSRLLEKRNGRTTGSNQERKMYLQNKGLQSVERLEERDARIKEVK